MRYDEIMIRLQSMANPENAAGMARFGINPHHTLGISVVAGRPQGAAKPEDTRTAEGLTA
jgi:hypothetical protein